MGDRMPAMITIGGPITKELLDELVEHIDAEGCGPDFDGSFDGEEEIRAYVEDAIAQRKPIAFADAESSGTFDFEDFLVKSKITYARTTEAKYENSGEYVRFDGNLQILYGCDQDHNPMVNIAVVLLADKENRLDRLIADLRRDTAPLEPLTLVDEMPKRVESAELELGDPIP